MGDTNATSRRARRAIAGTVAGVLLAGGALVVTAAPAGAHDSIDHFCGSLRLPDDNGPVTDLVHHAVEPLNPPVIHHLSCQLSGLELNLLQLLGVAPR
jgi:hypothetical protein